MPLYARLPANQQHLIFKKSKRTRIILATNVAETSLTVPGIIYVIDSGLVRISRYNYRSKLQRLALEKTSQASAAQRAGRCGRVQPGVCVRLYPEDDHIMREPFSDPEIIRTNLASVILRMSVLGLGVIEKFPFIDRPDRRFIKDGYRLLEQLQAVNSQHRVTKLGRRMAQYPLDPRLAKSLVSAVDDGCLKEIRVISSGLSAGDPRLRPQEKAAAADMRHRVFVDKQSDFVTLLNIWQAWSEFKGSNAKRRKWCQENFLSYVRMQEWHDVFLQLIHLSKDQNLIANKRPASAAKVHIALLRGFLDHIGQRKNTQVYSGARGREFKIFPGSGVANKPPNWVVAAQIVETSQVYARQVAQIQASWIEVAGSHMTRKHCIDQLWNKQRGCPLGIEEVTLFGFVLSRSRQVHLAKHDQVGARQAFIRQALVENRWQHRAAFIKNNQSLREQVALSEAKLRRIILDEDKQFAAFDKFIPEDVVDRKSFVQWWKESNQEQRNQCSLQLADIGDEAKVSPAWFPSVMNVAGNDVHLSYVFDPSNNRDGVTMAVPAPLLSHLKESQIEWLIPGWLKQKVEALLKRLTKSTRKQLVPVTNTATEFLKWAIDQQLPGGPESLRSALSRFVRAKRGVVVEEQDWAITQLPEWMHLGIAVLDTDGHETAWARSHAEVAASNHDATVVLAAEANSEWLMSDVSQWDFGDLPDTVSVHHGAINITASPVLVDKNHRVDMELVSTLEDVPVAHGEGVARLIAKHLSDKQKYLRKNLPDLNRLSVLYLQLGEFDQLFDDIIMSAIKTMVPKRSLIRRESEFSTAVRYCRENVIKAAQEITASTLMVLTLRQQIVMRLEENKPRLSELAYADMTGQLNRLLSAAFVRATPTLWMSELPRYLEAIEARIKKHLRTGSETPEAGKLIRHQQRFEQMLETDDLSKPDYAWMIEEWRVSLFAQELGTRMPISEKRINKYLSSDARFILPR